MLDKEAALFVTSGTMGNLIASEFLISFSIGENKKEHSMKLHDYNNTIRFSSNRIFVLFSTVMVHCNERGSEAYCGEESHTVLHEQGGAAQVAGVTLSPIPNDGNGSFDLGVLKSKLRKDRLHEPVSKLVMVENPINGKIISQSWIENLTKIAKKSDLKLHLDGARMWNAVVATNMRAEDFVRPFDSVTFCLSKGLGAPVGSLLCGSRSFIDKARRVRKVLGGGMRQAGVLAAAGLVALDETLPLLKMDHERANKIRMAVNETNSKACLSGDSTNASTNMIFIEFLPGDAWTARSFVERLSLVSEHPKEPKVIVRALALTEYLARMVTHRDIDDDLVDAAIRKIKFVLNE